LVAAGLQSEFCGADKAAPSERAFLHDVMFGFVLHRFGCAFFHPAGARGK
jgi:hypothetical protein